MSAHRRSAAVEDGGLGWPDPVERPSTGLGWPSDPSTAAPVELHPTDPEEPS